LLPIKGKQMIETNYRKPIDMNLITFFTNFSNNISMTLIKSFEEMEGWKKARELNKQIYEITSAGEFYHDFALKNQIRRSSISIMANIAEGFERNSKMQKVYFMHVAIGSSSETGSHLYLAKDMNYISEDLFNSIIIRLKEISRILNGFTSKLK